MLCLIDEFTHEALAIRVKRKLNSTDVLEALADVMMYRSKLSPLCQLRECSHAGDQPDDFDLVRGHFASNNGDCCTSYNDRGHQCSSSRQQALPQ